MGFRFDWLTALSKVEGQPMPKRDYFSFFAFRLISAPCAFLYD